MASLSKKKSFLLSFLGIFLIVISILSVMAFIAFRSIPSVANINSCFTTSMFQVELCPKKSSYVRFQQLPKHLVSALIASEDASFYFHKGFDWDEIQDSVEKSMDAGRWVRGGSTLTQQLAKNLYLTQERSLLRKMKEFFVAKEIEKKLSKSQIIEKYFNVVEFGKNIYGIKKASSHYFQKSPGDLTPAEGAYLVSLLPSPIKYSSAFHASKELSRFNKKRVARLLSLLRLQGKISEEEYNSELARVDNGLWSWIPTQSTYETWPSSPQPSNSSLEDSPSSETPATDDDDEAPAIEGDYQ